MKKVIGAIIQARTGSKRLPNKVIKTILGRPILYWVIDKVKKIENIDKIIVATTTLEEDNIIEEIVKKYDDEIIIYRGSVENVLDRYYKAALCNNLEIILRVTSDDPLIDPRVGSCVIDNLLENNADYSSNNIIKTYPLGMDLECFTFNALKEAWTNSKEDYQKQHVTKYIYENKNKFNISYVYNEKDYSHYRWTIDEEADFMFVNEIYKRIKKPQDFSWMEVIEILEKEKSLININKNICQKKDKEI